MTEMNIIPVLVGLSILSIVDFLTYDKKKGYIPSILTTVFLLMTFAITQNVFMAILSALLGLALSDLNLWKGIADYKVFVAVGLTMENPLKLFIFALCMSIFGLASSLALKRTGAKEMPYIPIILIGWSLSLCTFILLHL